MKHLLYCIGWGFWFWYTYMWHYNWTAECYGTTDSGYTGSRRKAIACAPQTELSQSERFKNLSLAIWHSPHHENYCLPQVLFMFNWPSLTKLKNFELGQCQ